MLVLADAVQVLTGCTFGKGNFIYKDFGKIGGDIVQPQIGPVASGCPCAMALLISMTNILHY